MPQFAYQGRNARGELVKGVIEGANSGAVADQLFNTGITPVHINETQGAPVGAATGGAGGGLLQMRFGEQRVELADLMLFSRQMHTLLKSGVPIVRGLAGLQDSAENPALRAALGDVRAHLEAGRELSLSMRQHPKVFTSFMVSLVRVGELTGRLALGLVDVHRCDPGVEQLVGDGPAIRAFDDTLYQFAARVAPLIGELGHPTPRTG